MAKISINKYGDLIKKYSLIEPVDEASLLDTSSNITNNDYSKKLIFRYSDSNINYYNSNLNFSRLDNVSFSVKITGNEEITEFESMEDFNEYLNKRGFDSNVIKDDATVFTESYNILSVRSSPWDSWNSGYTNYSAEPEPTPMFDFCGCCNESVFRLSEKTVEERVNGTDNLGMKSIVACESCKYDDLDEHGKELIDWCRDFIIYKEEQYKKYGTDYFDIRLWDFVSDFLGFEKDSGYDYWLLSFLEWNDYSCHGTSIRYDCSVPNDDKNRTISDDRYEKINEWSEKKLTNNIINSVN